MKYLWYAQSKSTNKIMTSPAKPSIVSCLHETLRIKLSAFGSLHKNVFPNLRSAFCLLKDPQQCPVLEGTRLLPWAVKSSALALRWHLLTAMLLPRFFLFNGSNNREPRVLKEMSSVSCSIPGPGTLLTVQCGKGLFLSPDCSLVAVTEWA